MANAHMLFVTWEAIRRFPTRRTHNYIVHHERHKCFRFEFALGDFSVVEPDLNLELEPAWR